MQGPTGQLQRQEDVEMTNEEVLRQDETLEREVTSSLVRLKKIKLTLLSDIVSISRYNM